MPDLKTLGRWEKYVPNLGDNREQEKPFFLLVQADLTIQAYSAFLGRFQAWLETPGDEPVSTFVGVFDGLVKMGSEPLSINGEPVTDFPGYVKVLLSLTGIDLVLELVQVIRHYNSVEGTRELFFERLSGGRFTTLTGLVPTAAQSSGTGTNH